MELQVLELVEILKGVLQVFGIVHDGCGIGQGLLNVRCSDEVNKLWFKMIFLQILSVLNIEVLKLNILL